LCHLRPARKASRLDNACSVGLAWTFPATLRIVPVSPPALDSFLARFARRENPPYATFQARGGPSQHFSGRAGRLAARSRFFLQSAVPENFQGGWNAPASGDAPRNFRANLRCKIGFTEESFQQRRISTLKPEQCMFRLNVGRTVLAGLVARKENHASGLLRVAFKRRFSRGYPILDRVAALSARKLRVYVAGKRPAIGADVVSQRHLVVCFWGGMRGESLSG
jgi:hypothetical protein